MTNLDPDLQRILNVNAKVYNTKSKRQGRVVSVSADLVIVDYGNKAKSDTEEYDIEDFSQMLVEDTLVANSRLTMDSKDNFKIKPRPAGWAVNMAQDVRTQNESGMAYTKDVHPPKPFVPAVEVVAKSDLEIGYINFPTGRFSSEPKKGYTKVEYRKAVEKVTIEVDSEMMEKLKEMGLVK